jgi:hypothetical protein
MGFLPSIPQFFRDFRNGVGAVLDHVIVDLALGYASTKRGLMNLQFAA